MNRFKSNNYLYDWISCIIPDRIYFGPIPNSDMMEQLIENKFNLIVNLTETPYIINNTPDITLLHFPIIDNSVPENIPEYCKFIVNLKRLYESDKIKMYIHCKGGHSRSSMVTVSLLFCIYNQELKEIINTVIDAHRSRVTIREIWKFKSPFNYKQFMFLCTIHKNVYINSNSDSKVYNWLSPKNIWVNNMNTLDDYVQCSITNGKPIQLFDLIKQNTYLLSRIKNTYLKKLTFIFEDKTVSDFYNYTFKNVREHLAIAF